MDSHITSHRALTLCIPRRYGSVLLGVKKRGFGMGKWNGFGGKVESGETIEEAAVRECREEACIEVTSMEKMGRIRFVFAGDPVAMDVHVFRVDAWDGEAQETEEMRPQWFKEDAVPFDAMWADDRHWFPHFLAGEKFRAEFFYEGTDVIVAQTIEPAMAAALA